MTVSRFALVFFILTHLSGHAQRTDFWTVDFFKADSIANLYENHDLKHPDQLAEKLVRDLTTDAEKFRSIFYWITQNISYDDRLFHKMQVKEAKLARNRNRLRAWNEKVVKKSFARTLKQKKAICFGYSLLLKSMCNSVGLSCVMLKGYGRTLDNRIGAGKVNHAWNAVSLNDKWYLCDATWATGFYDGIRKQSYRKFNKNYFLADPSLFVANHFPTDTTWILLLEKPTLREFLDAPIKVDGFLTNKINNYSPEKGVIKAKKGEQVTFSFTSNRNDIQSAEIWIKGPDKAVKSTYVLKKNKEGQYVMECLFEERGRFSVEISINSHHSFEYDAFVY